MAGEAAARGISQLAGTDVVRNLPAQLNDMLDDIALLLPYKGTATLTITTGGFATLTHNMGVVPSSLIVQSKTNQFICHLVDTLATNTVRTRWLKGNGTSPNLQLQDAAAGDTVTCHWIGLR